MKTTENNKLIAQFMGVPSFRFGTITKYQTNNPSKEAYSYPENLDFENDLKYNSSWDWLMPVVEKIRKTTINIDINIIGDVSIQCGEGEAHKEIITLYEECNQSNLEMVYRAVVEFIKQ